MYKTVSLMTILSLLLSSCCSIASSQTRCVTVTAAQNDAEVFIDGYACGTTPLSVDLDKRYDHKIVVAKAGYQAETASLNSHHTLKGASNLLTPIAGAAVGTGIGLAYFGTGGYGIPFCLIGTGIGLAVGLGLGVAGAVADLHLRSDCDLDHNSVHFNLMQAN